MISRINKKYEFPSSVDEYSSDDTITRVTIRVSTPISEANVHCFIEVSLPLRFPCVFYSPACVNFLVNLTSRKVTRRKEKKRERTCCIGKR